MSIFAELNKQNTVTTEVVTAKDIEKSFKEYAAAEHAANVLSSAATVIKHFAEEGVTAIAADSINIHIDNASALTQSEITRKFSKEDFSDTATPETRAVIAAASAEDFNEKAKSALVKAIEFLRKLIKKIKDFLTNAFGRKNKLVKDAVEEMDVVKKNVERPSVPYHVKSNFPIASNHLIVNNKFDPFEAVTSLHKNADTLLKLVQHNDFGLFARFDMRGHFDADRAVEEILSVYSKNKAKDLKFIMGDGFSVAIANGKIKTTTTTPSKVIRQELFGTRETTSLLEMLEVKSLHDKINTAMISISRRLAKIADIEAALLRAPPNPAKMAVNVRKAITTIRWESNYALNFNMLASILNRQTIIEDSAFKFVQWSNKTGW